MRPTICSLSEPHYKQNLYTNPKRTAKSSSLTKLDTTGRLLVQKIFSFQRIFRLESNSGQHRLPTKYDFHQTMLASSRGKTNSGALVRRGRQYRSKFWYWHAASTLWLAVWRPVDQGIRAMPAPCQLPRPGPTPGGRRLSPDIQG